MSKCGGAVSGAEREIEGELFSVGRRRREQKEEEAAMIAQIEEEEEK